MSLNFVEMTTDVPTSNIVKTFAIRLARMRLLERLCPPDHPVLMTERQLVDMARQDLQKYVASAYSLEEFSDAVERMKPEILSIAERRVFQQVEDDSVRDSVIEAIGKEDFLSLIPVVN